MSIAPRSTVDSLLAALDSLLGSERFGTTHRVSGEIVEWTESCLPLSNAASVEIYLGRYYQVHDGSGWTVLTETYYPPYTKYAPLVTTSNDVLEQEQVVDSTPIGDDGGFELSWREEGIVFEGRTPYLEARPISPAFEDPTDPYGHELTPVKRVYKLYVLLSVPDEDPDVPGQSFGAVLEPSIDLEFWGTETSKSLPPLRAGPCFPLEG